jgi:hypothetical protein
VDLWQFVKDGLVNSHDKRKDKIVLYLISSALHTSILSPILYEFGHIDNAKMFWDILEMNKWSENAKVDEGIDSLVTRTKIENDIIEVANF